MNTPGHPASAAGEADEDGLRDGLAGLTFPAARHDAVAHATDRGGLDDRLLDLLQTAPDRVYSSVDDLVISVPDPADGRPSR